MKKLIALLLSATLLLIAFPVFAEGIADAFVPFLVADGYTEYPVDGMSDTPTTMNITFIPDEYDGYSSFAITLNDQAAEVTGEDLSGDVYAVHLYGGSCPVWGTLFMVEDLGMNDYSYSYCYLVSDGIAYDLGAIPGRPTSIIFNTDGTMTTRDRANLLSTWNYTVDYVISFGYQYEEDNYLISYALTRIPADTYTIGRICTLNVDLPVLATVLDTQYSDTLTAGQQVTLVSTDLKSRVYIASLDGSVGGWVWVDPSDYPTKVAVNGEWQDEDVVFSNQFYAG